MACIGFLLGVYQSIKEYKSGFKAVRNKDRLDEKIIFVIVYIAAHTLIGFACGILVLPMLYWRLKHEILKGT